jgi:hypothetical protein
VILVYILAFVVLVLLWPFLTIADRRAPLRMTEEHARQDRVARKIRELRTKRPGWAESCLSALGRALRKSRG